VVRLPETHSRTTEKPAMYTVGQAAKATGKAKSTISKAINNGTISATKNDDGSYSIDPAELHRVFPAEVSANSPEKRHLDDLKPSTLLFENGRLQGELQQLRERVAEIDTMHDRERSQLNEQLEDFRKRLDRADEERRDKDRQLTALLTDQRKKPAGEPEAGPDGLARFPASTGRLKPPSRKQDKASAFFGPIRLRWFLDWRPGARRVRAGQEGVAAEGHFP